MIYMSILIWDCGSDVGLESAPFRRNNCLKVKMRPMLSRCLPVMVLVKQCLQCHWHQILSKTRDATSVLLYLSRIKSSLLLATNNFITSLEGFLRFFFKRFVLMPLQSPWVYFCNLWCFQVSLDPIRKSKEESCRWSLVIVWRRIFSVTNDSWSWNHFFVICDLSILHSIHFIYLYSPMISQWWVHNKKHLCSGHEPCLELHSNGRGFPGRTTCDASSSSLVASPEKSGTFQVFFSRKWR